jgi:hypothetical protein
MVASLNTMVIYRRILTLKSVGTVVNYCGIFITLAPGVTSKRIIQVTPGANVIKIPQ